MEKEKLLCIIRVGSDPHFFSLDSWGLTRIRCKIKRFFLNSDFNVLFSSRFRLLLDLLALLGVRLEDKEFSGLSRYISQMSSYVAFWFSEYTCNILKIHLCKLIFRKEDVS